MPMEHRRPNGDLAQGYFCGCCGAPGMSMYGHLTHGDGKCERNIKLVLQLTNANPPPGIKPHYVIPPVVRCAGL